MESTSRDATADAVPTPVPAPEPSVPNASPPAAAAAAAPTPAPAPAEPEAESKAITTTAALNVTVLVQSGVRHSFVVDRGYLERHAIAGVTDPLDMSVYQLKECIFKDWREDWDQRPTSVLFIKLIHFGAYMEDTSPLKDCRLNSEGANVIHMAIRPAEAGDDDVTQRSTKGAFGGTRGDREGSGSSTGCRCVIL